MIALINDLWIYPALSGKQPLNLEPVDLKELFDDTIMILQSKADARK